jgi:hypothetical protein
VPKQSAVEASSSFFIPQPQVTSHDPPIENS